MWSKKSVNYFFTVFKHAQLCDGGAIYSSWEGINIAIAIVIIPLGAISKPFVHTVQPVVRIDGDRRDHQNDDP